MANIFGCLNCRLTELANQAPALIEMVSKLSGNSSVFSSFKNMEPQFLYLSYSVQKFIIIHLQNFNGLYQNLYNLIRKYI